MAETKATCRNGKVPLEEKEESDENKEKVVPRTIGLMGGVSFIVGTIIGQLTLRNFIDFCFENFCTFNEKLFHSRLMKFVIYHPTTEVSNIK